MALQPREVLTTGWPRKSPPCVYFTPLALSPFPFLFSPPSCAGHQDSAINWPNGRCSHNSGPRHLPTALYVSGGTASCSNHAFLSAPFQTQPSAPCFVGCVSVTAETHGTQRQVHTVLAQLLGSKCVSISAIPGFLKGKMQNTTLLNSIPSEVLGSNPRSKPKHFCSQCSQTEQGLDIFSGEVTTLSVTN